MQDFFITFFSSALIILAGASYALLFAWSKVNANFRIKIASYISYLVLIVAVFYLTQAANFTGYWLSLSVVMVIFLHPSGFGICALKRTLKTTTQLWRKNYE